MQNKKLPDGAYAALEGLKAQASAAMLMLPDMSKAEGKKELKNAHAKIAANEAWAKRILSALMSGDGQETVDTVDAEWLENIFSETSV